MTNEEAIKHLTAKLECLTRSKGFREKCDTYNSYEGCYECDLAYKQGNIGEQIESLKLAIEALEQKDVLDKIREDINNLTVYYTTKDKGINLISQRAVNRVIDKYRK
jgi:hypothetical protein